MKKTAFLALLLTATTSFGAMVDADMIELRLQGDIDFDNPQGLVETDLNLGLGYFVIDDLQVGGLLGFVNNGSDAGVGFGVFSEMLFDLNYMVAPFIGASAQFRFGEIYSANHLLVEFNTGMKFFLTDYLALSGTLFFNLATEDIYVKVTRGQEDKNYNSGLRLGLSVYF